MPDPINSTPPAGSTVPGFPPSNDPTFAGGNTGMVNPGQLPNAFQPQMQNGAIQREPGSLSAAEVQTLHNSYNQRISDLQSRADKSAAALALLQQQYTELQTHSSQSLQSATEAAQNAITTANQLRTENAALKGENQSYKVLEAHPNLTPYREFLPKGGTEEELNAAIAKLNAIREQEQAKLAAAQPPPPLNTVPPTPGTPVNPMLNPFQALYSNRPNVNPMAAMNGGGIPGSTPAAINPAGAGTTNQSIAALLKDAGNDPVKFAQALEQAKALVPQAVNEQLGGAR